jgi:ribosome-associated toxin RatA of RatAB toxin-antitoxin module
MDTTINSPIRRITIDTSPAFAHRCVESAVIPASADKVYQAILRVQEWPNLLPHIQSIEIQYDDGQYQEFFMTVQSESDGTPLRVRSVRNCRQDEIEFFQPVPPRYLEHHGGIWRFHRETESTTRVEVTHVWNVLSDVACEVFPPNADAGTEEQIQQKLAGHSRLTLAGWHRVFSNEGS